jgi:hypothetical protein
MVMEIKIADMVDNFPFKFCSPHGLPICAVAHQKLSIRYQCDRLHTHRTNGYVIGDRMSLASMDVPCTVGDKTFVIRNGSVCDINA